ncbi:mannose/fructose/sorbose PTS transporter subunit IIB [Candidatus Enterococcus leclercqii]|uniref:mannose/fructose/sorbose PTS transporter subunit IIB n=1 Tax=Candidatus Enterococcus leclercqii TaxID=1857218 RepID=UPI001379E203|nr:mannose/fructose/sorbose PTS transporter subunit IIB [Enterococcus sp. CU9D]KAF1291810.1 PTS fructose transporter subunit IIB [Enterococcus sp. CU9D]
MEADIRLARIDDRLIHGQVATAWSKQTGVNRIIVVSDEAANDSLRSFLLREAAPPGIKVNVIDTEKMIRLYFSELLIGEKLMLLFTNPRDVLRLVEAGVGLQTINIGGMRYIVGKRMITNFISVDTEDIRCFRILAQRGITLEVRKVPSDRKLDLIELLDKDDAKSSLQ